MPGEYQEQHRGDMVYMMKQDNDSAGSGNLNWVRRGAGTGRGRRVTGEWVNGLEP